MEFVTGSAGFEVVEEDDVSEAKEDVIEDGVSETGRRPEGLRVTILRLDSRRKIPGLSMLPQLHPSVQ